MQRILAAAAALTFLLFAGPSVAQVRPPDTGAGTQRGLQQMNNSGQIGEVTLFPRGARTLVAVDLRAVPAGRAEPAHIHRGKDCAGPIDPDHAYALNDVVNGRSVTLVDAPISKLLSGNYVVVVHSNAAPSVAAAHMSSMAGMSGMSSMPGMSGMGGMSGMAGMEHMPPMPSKPSPKNYVACGLLY